MREVEHSEMGQKREWTRITDSGKAKSEFKRCSVAFSMAYRITTTAHGANAHLLLLKFNTLMLGAPDIPARENTRLCAKFNWFIPGKIHIEFQVYNSDVL